MTDLRYPIGRFTPPPAFDAAVRRGFVSDITELPRKLSAAVENLSDAQLDTPYRPGGWSVRQLVHHVADSHMNAFTRLKLALTEEAPTIKPYNETAWAELADSLLPVATSLRLITTLHERWHTVLASMTPADFARTYRHPDTGVHTVDHMVALYAWHGRHHTAHVTALRERSGWS